MGFLAAIPAALAGLGAGGAGAAGVTGAATAAGASATSSLIGAGASIGTSLLGAALMKPPKLPSPPQAPALSSSLSKNSLIGPYEGSANGTFLSGTNQRGSSSGGKTLLGQ